MRIRTTFLAYFISAFCASLHAQTSFVVVAPAGGGGGSGTVTSVGLTAPAQITVTGSPVTTSGSIALSWASAAQGTVFAGPCSGGAGTPVFRALCAADIPALPTSAITGTAVITSDARLSDARTPTAHASTHASAGSDPVTLAQSQVTDLATDIAAKVPTSRTITAGTNLTGGGDLSANRTLNLADSITLTSVTAAVTGNASTASALAANPADCSAGTFATTIAASGNLTCAALTATDIPSPLTSSTSGNAGTATALAANPTDCAGGEFATSIDASGNLTCSTPSGSSPPFADNTALVADNVDATKLFRFELGGFTTGTTIVATPPATSFAIARTDAAQTFTGAQTFPGTTSIDASGKIGINVAQTSSGLTVENGAYLSGAVAVKPGTASFGSGVMVGGVVSTNTSALGNTAGTETFRTLSGITNSQSTSGMGYELHAGGTFAASATTDKRVRVYFSQASDQLIFDTGPLAITTAESWMIVARIYSVSTTSQKCIVQFISSSTTLSASAKFTTTTANTAAIHNAKVSATGTDANDVVIEAAKLIWLPN